MTVFISHAGADQTAAEALEGVLERRGLFVERDDGEVALEPVAAHDVVVVMLSHAFAADANKLRLTQRALDAWSAGRLVLVRLDETPAPIGLRDWPALDASISETRDLVWVDVATSIQKLGGAAAAPSSTPKRGKRGGFVGVLINVVLIAPGLFVIAASASIWLANRIGPRPGGLPELLAGIDSLGRYYGVPAGVTPMLFGAALLVLLGVLARLAFKVFARRRPSHAAKRGDGVFVSCAPEDRERANALMAAAAAAGAPANASARVTDAGLVFVLCSAAAYQSDQVKRDLFLAERAGKRVTPVFLEAAPPPEDFAYFFAGAAGVTLHGATAAEQGRLLAGALGAPHAEDAAPIAPRESQAGSPASGA